MGEFEDYVTLGHQFIAIGSTIKISDDIFKKIRDKHPNVRIHMFGNLNRKMLNEHKPYSADGASWAHTASRGCIFFWDRDEEKEYKIYLGSKDKKKDDEIHYKKFEHKSKLEHFLYETFHFEYSDLIRRGSAEARQIVNLYFFKQLEDHINNS